MSEQYPIVPTSEMVREWAITEWPRYHSYDALEKVWTRLAAIAAQWGADQELEACCKYLDEYWGEGEAIDLRDARRPKPPSLKQEALEAARIELNPKGKNGSLIIRALEALPDD